MNKADYYFPVVKIINSVKRVKWRGCTILGSVFMLSCGHVTFRKRMRQNHVCLKCYNATKILSDGLKYDETGQRIFL